MKLMMMMMMMLMMSNDEILIPAIGDAGDVDPRITIGDKKITHKDGVILKVVWEK